MIPRKSKVAKNGKIQWQLDFGRDIVGKRKRLYFDTEKEADKEISRLEKGAKSYGEFWLRLTPLERQSLVVTLQEIHANGLTIQRVWQEHQTQTKSVEAQSATSPKPYADVVDFWKVRKLEAGKTERYVENSAEVLLKFGAGREKQNIHEISPNELEAWLSDRAKAHDWTPSTKRTYMLLFSSLWETACSKGWASLNITERLEPITVSTPDVKIYPNEIVIRILAAVLDNELTKLVLAPVILCLKGCMRPEEVTSSKALRAGLPAEKLFGWQDIDLQHGRITVRKEIAKKGDQRTIKLQPSAIEWLKHAKKLGCELPPVNERRLIDAACELIDLDEWIRDGLRKCCATHLREVHKNDYDVVRDMGNSVRVLLKHYADLQITKEESQEFWAISPKLVNGFRKSKEWEQIKKRAAIASAKRRAQSASETAKPAD